MLTYTDLREANVKRTQRWEPGFPEKSAWDADYWLLALLGEIGETANVVKKLNRIEIGLPGAKDPKKHKLVRMLGDELADVILYADLYAAFLGVGVLLPRGIAAIKPEVSTPCALTLDLGELWGEAESTTELKSTHRVLRDMACTCHLVAGAFDIDLEQAVKDKFNKVSERQGFPERL